MGEARCVLLSTVTSSFLFVSIFFLHFSIFPEYVLLKSVKISNFSIPQDQEGVKSGKVRMTQANSTFDDLSESEFSGGEGENPSEQFIVVGESESDFKSERTNSASNDHGISIRLISVVNLHLLVSFYNLVKDRIYIIR